METPTEKQIYQEIALKSLKESGLPENLIDGVDCSSLETMKKTLIDVKNAFYLTIHRHIEDTYGVSSIKPEQLLCQMEYEEKNDWKMFQELNCSADNNKYIANLYYLISNEVNSTVNKGTERLRKKEHLLEKIIESGIDTGIESGIVVGIDKDLKEKFQDYIDLQGELQEETEKEGFILGFLTAYHLLQECKL